MRTLRRISDPQISEVFTRSERLVIDDNGYHYRTREGELIGPFVTESQALYDLNSFVELSVLQQQLLNDTSLELAIG